jgi:hypothetical protein
LKTNTHSVNRNAQAPQLKGSDGGNRSAKGMASGDYLELRVRQQRCLDSRDDKLARLVEFSKIADGHSAAWAIGSGPLEAARGKICGNAYEVPEYGAPVRNNDELAGRVDGNIAARVE